MSLAVLSCTKSGSEVKPITISVNPDNAIPLKESILSIEILALNDSLASHFPGSISKLEWAGDSILILDSWKDPGLYLYDSNGRLAYSYSDRGNGPEEFVNIVDFNVLPSGFVLLDNSAGQLIYLDRTLSFLSKEDSEPQANHLFSKIGNSHRFWYDRGNTAYGSNKDKLIYVEGDKRKGVLPVPREVENVTFASYNVFAKISNDTILYLPAVEPRIYKCHNGKVERFCELNFQDLWPDFSNASRSNPLELMRGIADSGKIYSTNLLSDGNQVAVTFYLKKDLYVLTFPYDDVSAHRLFKVDKEALKTFGALVSMKDGTLIFGEPGKLIFIRV